MTREGEEFISDLNLYLVGSGKNESEIREFIEEAEEHLRLGEDEGKTVKDIFGDSPEEYAKSVAEEMSHDIKQTIKYIFMFLFGISQSMFFQRIEDGKLGISKVEVISDLAFYCIAAILLVVVIKKFAFNKKKFNKIVATYCVCFVALLCGEKTLTKDIAKNIIFDVNQVRIIILVIFIISVILCVKLRSYMYLISFISSAPSLIETLANIRFGSIYRFISLISILLAGVLIVLEMKRLTEEEC